MILNYGVTKSNVALKQSKRVQLGSKIGMGTWPKQEHASSDLKWDYLAISSTYMYLGLIVNCYRPVLLKNVSLMNSDLQG